MNTKRLTLVSALALTALAPTMGSAQVVSNIIALIENTSAELNQSLDTQISSIAVNDGIVNGSIDITQAGQGGGAVNITSTDLLAASGSLAVNIDVEGATAGAGALGALGLGTDGSLAGDLAINFEDSLTNSFAANLDQTTFDMGELAAVAIGATNSGTLSFADAGELTSSASDAYTSNTGAAASFSQRIGANLDVREIAANNASILGNATIAMAGSGSLDGLTTTAVGAVNTSDLLVGIVGGNPSQVGFAPSSSSSDSDD